MMILRLLAAKAYEAMQFVKCNMKEASEFHRDYLADMPEPFAEALKDVRKRIEEGCKPLDAIRDKYAFHYDLGPHLDAGLDRLDASSDLSIYAAGEARHSSFNTLGELATVAATLSWVATPDLHTAMETVADATLDAAGSVLDLMEGIIIQIARKHSLNEGIAHIRNIDLPESLDCFKIPPLVRNPPVSDN